MEAMELKVNLHCKACEKSVRRSLFKLKGVTCVDIDVRSNNITVLGYADEAKIIKAIRKTGRRVEPQRQQPRRRSSSLSSLRKFLCFKCSGFSKTA